MILQLQGMDIDIAKKVAYYFNEFIPIETKLTEDDIIAKLAPSEHFRQLFDIMVFYYDPIEITIKKKDENVFIENNMATALVIGNDEICAATYLLGGICNANE